MVTEFIREKIVKKTGNRISHKKLYESYIRFCEENNFEPENKIVFGRTMNDFDFGACANYLGERIHRHIDLRE